MISIILSWYKKTTNIYTHVQFTLYNSNNRDTTHKQHLIAQNMMYLNEF